MAKLISREKNVFFQLSLISISEQNEIDYQTWINSELELKSPVVNCKLGKNINFALSKEETNLFVNKLANMIKCIEIRENASFTFINYEFNFEINMEYESEDEIVEVKVWINWASYTSGKDVGYDVGIKFISEINDLKIFLSSLKEEFKAL